MLERKQLIQLMKAALNTKPNSNFSFNGETLSKQAMDKTIQEQLNELIHQTDDYYADYRENWQKAFRLIEEAMSPVLPARVADFYSTFAEVKTYPQGTRPVFTRTVGRMRAKQFATRAALAGRYEVFKLGSENFELHTSSFGTACQVGFEELLDGRANLAELSNIVLEALDELLAKEVQAQLIHAINSMPAANRVATNGFSEDDMDRLITVASAYGRPVIYCSREFAVKMVPQEKWVSDTMRDELWRTGRLATYKGCQVVVLPTSMTDETNSTQTLDPGYAWVIPSGSDNKPVKIGFEGTMHMRDEPDNDDWSHTIHWYQKVGVGVIMTNNLCAYVDTSLQGKTNMI